MAAILLLSSALFSQAAASCPARCVCASDILSCGAQDLQQLPSRMPASTATLDLSHNRLERLEAGGFSGLPRLEVLRLAHNRLSSLAPGAFRNTSALRHLDLSSNGLRLLDRHSFQGLRALEELLLFDNRISRVESRALASLGRLQRAYLSHNRLTDFPFFSIRAHSHPALVTLDLSSNRLSRLPLEEVAALPVSVQSGLFLHNNTLACECGLYALLLRWQRRGFGSARDHRDLHTCLLYGDPRASIRFLRHARFFENCSLPGEPGEEGEEGGVRALAGDSVLLHCLTPLKGHHLSYLWQSPQQEYLAPPGNNRTLRVFANGSLLMSPARPEDSGVYQCTALDSRQQHNETLEVNVTVSARHTHGESFSTGFTTLLGCAVSLLLVLIYLYLTPCRCWCRRRPPPPPPPPAAPDSPELLTPDTTFTPAREGSCRRGGSSKHVAFLEPIREVQNGRVRAC
ncbi:amphoterin-induced protein 3-like [Megalops cyprinoides]|uniref:amphoterin-induced protein 3-like n=1 Tax=Megalops cyprinoides TaxID=118141 RepID=UPI001864843D|nr:amphoterin-induced protein 3-like [Megalops cyprinoides]